MTYVWWLVACNEPAPAPAPAPAPVEPALLPRFDGPVPQNLLMLSVDTMRRDHVGRYDPQGRGLTPFLDELMAESLVVDDAIGCSNWTVAATACVEAGATNVDRAPDRGMFPIAAQGVLDKIPQEPMLPRFLLDEGGYSSLLVTTNGYFSASYGNAQGYQTLIYDGPEKALPTWERAKDELLPERGGAPLPAPWFLHLHFFEPHDPYLPPDEYLKGEAALPEVPYDLDTVDGQDEAINAVITGSAGPSLEAAIMDHVHLRYEGEIAFLDAELRDIWTELDELGFLDDTLVVFWTDHGEELLDHDLLQHGKLLYKPENDITLFFWARNVVPGVWDGPVQGSDIAPTVLAQLGLPIPETMTGVPLGTAPADRFRHTMSDAYIGPVLAVVKDGWKMQFRWTGQRVFVYDTVADPLETVDLFDPADPRVLELWSALKPQIETSIPYVEQDPRGYELVWPADLP